MMDHKRLSLMEANTYKSYNFSEIWILKCVENFNSGLRQNITHKKYSFFIYIYFGTYLANRRAVIF